MFHSQSHNKQWQNFLIDVRQNRSTIKPAICLSFGPCCFWSVSSTASVPNSWWSAFPVQVTKRTPLYELSNSLKWEQEEREDFGRCILKKHGLGPHNVIFCRLRSALLFLSLHYSYVVHIIEQCNSRSNVNCTRESTISAFREVGSAVVYVGTTFSPCTVYIVEASFFIRLGKSCGNVCTLLTVYGIYFLSSHMFIVYLGYL